MVTVCQLPDIKSQAFTGFFTSAVIVVHFGMF